jgi:2,3-bisphosphoglycerate-independent phosphoglycerate mutase
MKYVIVIPDGAADYPLDELGGRTPLAAAQTPNMDALAVAGRQGTAVTTPEGFSCGSDVCTMSLLGYDPRRFHTGRAPLEAAALGIETDQQEWVFRVNLVSVIDGLMQDHSAGHISGAEGKQLVEEFADQLDIEGLALYPGVSYRNIMVDRAGRDWSELTSTPPHDIPGEPIRKYLPRGGEHAGLLEQFVAESEVFLKDHEINLTRKEMGELPATHVWPWGQGVSPAMPGFAERFGPRGAMITAVDLLAGLARFIGWDRLDVPGQSSYHDNDYQATGRHAVAALRDYGILCLHVESPDEAAHAADPQTKIATIESIDRDVVGPIVEALKNGDDPWRVLILPDHYTRIDTRKHDPTPVPFLVSGSGVRSLQKRPYTEANAESSDLHVPNGHELMEYFLHSGAG